MNKLTAQMGALTLLMAVCAGCASIHRQNTNLYPDPKPDEGLVYFYRESRFIGSLANYYIYEGDQKVGGLENGSYCIVWAAPGEHTYSNHLEGPGTVTLQVEANKTYFIRGDVTAGMWGPRADLIEVTAAQAWRSLTNLAFVALTTENK